MKRSILVILVGAALVAGYTNCSHGSFGTADSTATSGGLNSGAAGGSGSTPTVDQTGVLAVSANTFLNSTGVNIHASQGYNYNNYIAPLQYMGIRNIRDGDGNISALLALNKQTGVKVCLLSEGDLNPTISAGQTLAASNALLAFEGPNEPNNFTITYNGQTGGGSGSWVPVADYQQTLYSTVKGTSAVSNYPVFGVSEEGAETTNLGLQFTTVPTGVGTLVAAGTQYSDYVNVHNYVCSNENSWVDNMAWNAASPTLNAQWDGLYGEVGLTWDKHYQGYTNTQLLTVPRVTTETGWDSTANPGGQVGQGVVLTNTYLSQFKEGWSYTFIYELIDGEGSTGDQGLYTSSYSPKLVATYIHNLTTILADTASVTNPNYLNYTIANEPATVHDLLLQKSTGNFELVVWDERSNSTVDNVTVSLGQTYPTVNVYDITLGTTPTQTLTNVSSVSLTLNNHALIVEIPK